MWLDGAASGGVDSGVDGGAANQAPPGGGGAAGGGAAGGGAVGGGAAGGGAAEDALPALPALQGSLLRQAARYIRPGGRLVYATCSLDPAENGAVAEAFEREMRELSGDLGGDFAPWPFAADVAGREAARPHHRTLWPHRHDTDGFFVARWRRLAS